LQGITIINIKKLPNMKKPAILLLLIALSSFTVCAHDDLSTDKVNNSEGIQFHEGSWAEALALAKAENKLVFLDVYASWCGPCKRLKANTFTDENVASLYNASFINVAVDGEKGEGIELARKYGVRAYPSLIFVNPKGEIVTYARGYHNPEQFLQLGQEVLQKR
jgi:thioredoxin 1